VREPPRPSAGPLPLDAQEASYFAEDARMASFSPRSIDILYIRIGIFARAPWRFWCSKLKKSSILVSAYIRSRYHV
jgi:hypothetical protein